MHWLTKGWPGRWHHSTPLCSPMQGLCFDLNSFASMFCLFLSCPPPSLCHGFLTLHFDFASPGSCPGRRPQALACFKYVFLCLCFGHITPKKKTALKYCACFSASALSLPSSVGAVVAAAFQFLQNLVTATSRDVFLSCSTFCYSLHFNAQSGFNVLLSGICDLLRYIVIYSYIVRWGGFD